MTESSHAEAWALVQSDPEVVAALQALDALDAEEERLTLELGRALRRAQTRVEGATT